MHSQLATEGAPRQPIPFHDASENAAYFIGLFSSLQALRASPFERVQPHPIEFVLICPMSHPSKPCSG
jgi:hypothetical protein